MRSRFLKLSLCVAGMAALAVGAMPLAAAAFLPVPAGPVAQALSASARFFVPPPGLGALQQIAQLARNGDFTDAQLLSMMEATPQGVWFDGEAQSGVAQTPAQVESQVRQTMTEAGLQHAVPILVTTDIPGRDCQAYSAGGAPTDAAYRAWISGFAKGIGPGKAVVILEPDSLAMLPSDCYTSPGVLVNYYPDEANPPTDTTRLGDINYAVNALEADPNVSVYLDGGHSNWRAVGTMAGTLVAAGVQQAQGFALNVNNYNYTQDEVYYGTWVSDCIALGAGSTGYDYVDNCPSQYAYGLDQFGAWSDSAATADLNTASIDAAYKDLLGGTVPTTHFVIDTGRNGLGPNDMSIYTKPPYDQAAYLPGGVMGASVGYGSWCNPPGMGLGLRPTASTGLALVDAYLWIKVPGQSDSQCDAANGVRAWDYSVYTQAGWPTSGPDPATPASCTGSNASAPTCTFDPLWGLVDPPASWSPPGAWFPQEALQLAQDANPALTWTFP
jgi:endoglucanase